MDHCSVLALRINLLLIQSNLFWKLPFAKKLFPGSHQFLSGFFMKLLLKCWHIYSYNNNNLFLFLLFCKIGCKIILTILVIYIIQYSGHIIIFPYLFYLSINWILICNTFFPQFFIIHQQCIYSYRNHHTFGKIEYLQFFFHLKESGVPPPKITSKWSAEKHSEYTLLGHT